MSETQYREAPRGFTTEQRKQFEDDGFITIENVLGEDEIDRLLVVADRLAAEDPNFNSTKSYSRENIVEFDPAFAELIDHHAHIGFVYDYFGELLKLHLSHLLMRPNGGWHNLWHPDGPRAVPYSSFSSELPLCIKVGYWLTHLPEPKMGNLVVMPGSHKSGYFEHYDTHESAPGEHIVCVPRGAMTIMNSNTWHRVEPNESNVTRKNLFYAYCPAFVVAQDRYQNDPVWLETLTRERRIIMRSYAHPYANSKPPAADFPLYLDRETGSDRDEGMYRDHVELHRRRRLTPQEKLRSGPAIK